MAFITGGLGGLGMLASHELAMAGKDHVIATSRSGRPASMPPALVQLMSAMQAQCPHFMVKADGSDGAVMFDTMQAFCRPGFLTEQSITLGDVIDATRRQMDGMPEDLVKPALDTLENIQKEIQAISKEGASKAQFTADVSIADREEIKDREEEVAELIGKLKEKLTAKGGIKDSKSTALALSEQVTELGVKVRSITVPTTLAVPQRKMGVGECIVHAAGLLQDGLIVPNLQKAPDMFSKVYGAKAHGAWQIHCATVTL